MVVLDLVLVSITLAALAIIFICFVIPIDYYEKHAAAGKFVYDTMNLFTLSDDALCATHFLMAVLLMAVVGIHPTVISITCTISAIAAVLWLFWLLPSTEGERRRNRILRAITGITRALSFCRR